MARCIASLSSRVGLVAAGWSVLALAQPPAQPTPSVEEQRDIKIKNFPDDLKTCTSNQLKTNAPLATAVKNCLDQQKVTYLLLLAAPVAKNAVASVQVAVDEARVDKQIGAGSSSSGSTSLTSKGSVPAVLGFAVENGALERSTSGSTITFTIRPVQFIQALQSTPFSESYQKLENNGTLGFLNRFSVATTFDTTRGGTNGTFTGSSNQVSAVSTHLDLLNWRDPRSKRFKKQWDTLGGGALQDMTNKLALALNKLFEDAVFSGEFEKWKTAAEPDITNALQADDRAALAAATGSALDRFPSPTAIPGIEVLLNSAVEATGAMLDARQKILDLAGKAPIIAFDYTDNRAVKAVQPALQLPDTSDFKLIVEMAPFSGGSFTLNGSATIFNSTPLGFAAKRLRDLQVSAQLDLPVTTAVAKISNVVLSFSGKFEHVANDALPTMLTTATPDMLTGTGATLKGNLGLFQTKLTIPVKNTGIKIPLSFTYANRTELIKESDVRGNVGITFDLDTILGILKK